MDVKDVINTVLDAYRAFTDTPEGLAVVQAVKAYLLFLVGKYLGYSPLQAKIQEATAKGEAAPLRTGEDKKSFDKVVQREMRGAVKSAVAKIITGRVNKVVSP